ncbi:hypothetical protein SAMN05216532_8189 [Streptomyces sp. 2231.1]|nr:hypothetical protein SAMN05216532_8189 [Streptomyces sp. 2231.1]
MGRPSVFVHALIGSAQVLTAPTSVMLQPGLPDWPGVSWDAAGGLPRLPIRDLQQRFSEEEPHYRAAIEHVRPLLEAAVAQLIRTPENRLSFHAQELHAHAPVLIWALSTLLGPWLGDDAFTYVSGDGDEHLRLKLIFVPAWKVLMGERSLSRVFSKRSPDQARSIAEDLVDRFILDEGNPARAHNVLARCPNPRSRTLSERLDVLTRAL